VRNAGVSDCRASADYIEFIAYCGARKNEAANVQWRDIDFAEERVLLRVTKNGEPRKVPMIPNMRALLERLKRERKSTDLSDPVLLVKDVQGFISSACKKLAIPRFTTHTLRHLFGTACMEAGVDVRTAAEWLGHKDKGALLLKLYAHVRSSHEMQMAKKVSFAPCVC
jgi:integrase